MRNYKNIKAWQKADELVKAIYKITSSFPKEELYGITSQLRRAAVSIATNIVEGSSRQHKKDYLNFLFTSRGSLAEVEYLIKLSHDLRFLSDIHYSELTKKLDETASVLYGLVTAVEEDMEFDSSMLDEKSLSG